MRIGVMFAISLWMHTFGHPPITFTGVWVLNSQRSDFGAAVAPEHVVMQVERADQGLAVVEITTDRNCRHVTYRHITLGETGVCSGECASPAGTGRWVDVSAADESWQLSELGDLVIQRRVSAGARQVRQHLVLERSNPLAD